MRAAALESAPEAHGVALVDMPPPSTEAALALARFLVDTFARRALADLGVIPLDDPGADPGIANGNQAFPPDRSNISGGAQGGAMAAGR